MAYAANLDFNSRPDSRLAFNHHQHHHQKQQPPGPFDEIDALDSSLLDSEMISPASAGDRRDSFANSTVLFSPQSSNWEDFSAPALDRTQSLSTLSNNPFFEQNNNPFTRMERPHIVTYSQQPSSAWPLVDRTADSRTPFGHQAHDAYASEFEPAQPYMTVGSSAPAYNGLPTMPSNVRPSSIFPPNAQGIETPHPLSPQSGDKWMPLNNNDMDSRPLPKRMRQSSPPRSYSPGFPRRDGIRKKNARFEIPAERNLTTIDQMIQEATNEDDIKELKQQKRLLRNRQAALDSRQRKKKHTEDLEKEKHDWSDRMSMLEQELEALRIQSDRERVQWQDQCIQAQQQIETLMYEKEEMVAKHTIETGELRKKVNFLREKLESRPSAPATVTPSSTDFTDFAPDMNGLTMDQDEWNHYLVADPFFHEHDAAQQQPHANSSLVVASRPKQQQQQHVITDAEKPVASGLLFMLLLCGAFVASKSGSNQPIPRMPDDVRAASATVLDNILKDAHEPSPAGHSHAAQQLIADHVSALEPGPSGVASWHHPKTTLSGAEFASISNPSGLGIAGSNLDQLHHNLVMPTKEQEAEQLFSLTPNQYNSLTSTDFSRPAYMPNGPSDTPPNTDEASHSPPSGRKNLAQTLQHMRDEARSNGNAAEVYTRSLLWEKIPSDVVREFKRMVEESNKNGADERMVKSEA